MKRRAYLILCALVFGLCFFQFDAFAKDEWLQVHSKNFNLIGNASDKDIRRVATKLEQFRDVLSKILNKANFASPVPTTVIVFKNNAAYTPYKPVRANGKVEKFIGGYFQSGDDVNYITLPVNGTDDFSTIFHEYTHFIVDNNFGRTDVPPWFNEGLAEYYSTFKIEDDLKVTLGGLENNHLELLARNKLIPFDSFFNVGNATLHEQADDGVGLFYAQAWALMHYFIHGNNGARQKQMYKFLDLVTKNRQPKDAFAEAFATDYATMEKELKNYIAQNSFTTSLITFKEKLVFDGEMKSAPLSDAESKAYLGDLFYHTNRFAEAEILLRQSLALDSDLPQANISLGLVKMREKKFDEAKKYLEKALLADPKNYLAQYSYAYVLSREGMDANDIVVSYGKETAEKMRAALKKSIELNPKFAEAYNLYAFTGIVNGDQIDESIGYIRQALALARGNQYYLITLAQLDARKGNFAAAKKSAQKVFETAADDSLKAYARSVVRSIEEREVYAAKVKEYEANREKGGVSEHFEIVTDKPLTEAETAALREKMLYEAVAGALRKPEAGERRVLGFLSKIQCGAKGIVYSFKTENQSMTFTSKDFSSLILMSFDDKIGDQPIGCDGLKAAVYAVLTYRPNDAPGAKTAGEVVAVEFVPEKFKLEK